ncbi:DUF3828 domain-containing protein [Flavobacterium sp. DG1-102-2]|uniref:DUF3828 domain-containing protein n=1 Tax=Flavobacterium sp. DG1-102-2 TaxID=3081663 RepID=UPI002949D226|nr:DUF3828 domain-containing protein [Flavobacterium sp. DG1-102-2]MDV6167556.1 DUF3828 domain-containing protein [Flavobacterium sp. DG1-102-2]
MRNFIGLAALCAVIFGCQGNKQNESVDTATGTDSSMVVKENVDVKATSDSPGELYATTALNFINGYVEDCNKEKNSKGVVEWVAASPLATNRLKRELKTMVDEAFKEDPELGLDADPIFDAQDYPEEGFELESLDEKTGYVVVRGKKWKEFTLTLKLVNENGKWLVDGCGIVNIPPDRTRMYVDSQ